MTLSIRITLSRCTGVNSTTYQLQLTDIDAGVRFVSTELTPEQFAALVSGSEISADADVRVEVVGMRAELREVVLTFPSPVGPHDARESMAAAIISEAADALDTDAPVGATPWKGQVMDAFNYHRRVNYTATTLGFKARITFRRFVPRGEG